MEKDSDLLNKKKTVQIFSFCKVRGKSREITCFLYIKEGLTGFGSGGVDKTNRIVCPAEVQIFHIFMCS